MYAVSISLGASNAYVAAAQVTPNAEVAPIRVIANSGGHRSTPVAAALTDQEVLFGENATHFFARQPQKVVPYLFSYAAAAAALSDASESLDDDSNDAYHNLLAVVQKASQKKFKGHLRMVEEPNEGSKRIRMGYNYGDDEEEKFVSTEDLFVQFLNHVKAHSIDGVCGLTRSGDPTSPTAASPTKEKGIFLTIVVPRYAFPAAATPGQRSRRHLAVDWLQEAVRASQLNEVTVQTSIIFSDEAPLLAFDSSASRASVPHFLLPPNASEASQSKPVDEANVLVVDWGSNSLAFSFQRVCGGLLTITKEMHGNTPYLCSTLAAPSSSSSYFSSRRACGGDAIDVALAERVAANYMIQQRRVFSGQVRNMNVLMQLNHNLLAAPSADGPPTASSVISECIPARAMRRLALLMEEKKIALNTNPQANSVGVEVEAFYEGMDLQDNQTLSRNKFESAVNSDWSLADMFEKALKEFCERYADVVKQFPITHVVLTGGMCQMQSVVQMITRVVKSSRDAAIQAAVHASMTVLDPSMIGNGVSGGELPAVGGCLNSYHLATIYAKQKDLKQPLKKKAAASKIDATARKEALEVCTTAWGALTRDASDDDDDDSNEGSGAEKGATAEDDEHVNVLTSNVYVYTGDDASALSSETVTIPKESVAQLFAKHAPLPSRVVSKWSTSSGADSSAVYLFTDAADANALRPAASTGIAIPPCDVGETGDSLFVVFTVHTKSDDDGVRRVALSVQLVRSHNEELPAILTPHNTVFASEVFLV